MENNIHNDYIDELIEESRLDLWDDITYEMLKKVFNNIVAGSLILSLITSSYIFGLKNNLDAQKLDKLNTISTLLNEIEDLKEKKLNLEILETYDLKSLSVIKLNNIKKEHYCIVERIDSNLYREINNCFYVTLDMRVKKEHPEYIYINYHDMESIYYYFNDDEINYLQNKNGKITNQELNILVDRINNLYKNGYQELEMTL